MALKDIFKKTSKAIQKEIEEDIQIEKDLNTFSEDELKVIERYFQSEDYKQLKREEYKELGKEWFKLYQKKNEKVEIIPEPTEETQELTDEELLEQFNVEGMNETPDIVKLKNKL